MIARGLASLAHGPVSLARGPVSLGRGLAAAALLWLSACAGSPPPPDSFHRLPVPSPAARATPLLEGVVEVDRFAAIAALRSRPLAVVDSGSGVLRQARYDHWVDGPPGLLQQALVAYLRAAGVAGRVVTPELRDDPRWIVTGRIQHFERVAGAGGGAAVTVELALRERASGPPRVHGVYEAARSASADSAPAAVEALGLAVGEVFAAFVADVEAELGRP